MARQLNGIAELGGATPIQAAMALASGNGMPPELQEMLLEELRDQMEARKRAKAKKENQALANAQATAEALKHQQQERARCSHKKLDGTTRLAGQFLSGTGQLFLTCQFCHIEYFNPPNPALGQIACPAGLMPQADEIGG